MRAAILCFVLLLLPLTLGFSASSNSYTSTVAVQPGASASSDTYTSQVDAPVVAGTSASSNYSQQLGLVSQYSLFLLAPKFSGLTSDAFTSSADVYLDTDRVSVCRYADTSGLPFAEMNVFSSTNDTFHETTISGLQSSSSYNYYVRCSFAGVRSSEQLVTFSTTAAGSGSTGGGAGGGGGGGFGFSTPSNSSQTLQVSLSASGSRESFTLTRSQLSVKELSFTLAQQVATGSVTVSARSQAPQSFSREVYEFFEVEHSSSLQAVDVEFVFEVSRSWIDTRNASADQVRLYRLSEGSWTELDTLLASSTNSTLRFSAQSPGFSFFAVSTAEQESVDSDSEVVNESEEANASAPIGEEVVVNESTNESSTADWRDEVEPEQTTSWFAWILGLVVVGGVVGGGLFVYTRRSHTPISRKESDMGLGARFVSAAERFDHELERAYNAIQREDYATASQAYLFARDAYRRAVEHESLLWHEEAHKRLTKVYDVLVEERGS